MEKLSGLGVILVAPCAQHRFIYIIVGLILADIQPQFQKKLGRCVKQT